MKNVIVLIIVIFSTFKAQAEFQLRKKEFGAYEIKNFQCSLDTVISEPYAIVEFKYNFNQIKATETHYLTVTTEFACKQYKLDSTGTVQSIVNDSFIEFRIEDQNGKEFMHEYAKYIMPGKRSVFVLNRKCEKPLDTEPKIVPIQTIQRKPVIYLYGNTGEQYEVKIPKSTALIATYPKPVNNVWKVKI